MNIREVEEHEIVIYQRCARDCGNIFNSLEWASLFGNRVRILGLYDKGNSLVGGFVLYKENRFGLSFYRNPPFTPTIGPFLKIDAKSPVSIMDTWKNALSSLSFFLEKLDYSLISISLARDVLDTQPFIWRKFKVSPGYTYLLDLLLSVENLWKIMSSERRKNITKAIKDGLISRKCPNHKLIKSLILSTFSRQNKKINEIYLDKILFEFAKDDNSFAFITFNDDYPIACSFCVYDKDTAYYLLGGYDHERKHHGAGALSMWEAIKYAQKLGLKYFDFEGSMVPQIEKYFRGFGGLLTPYYRINKAKMPIEIAMKFIKRELF